MSADCEFPTTVREECDLFMVAHYVDESSVLTLFTVAGLQFTREELAAPPAGADPFTVRRLLCFRIIAARLIFSSENCRLLEDANARAAATAAASLSVARTGDALMERLEQLQTAGMSRGAVHPPPTPSMVSSVGSLLGPNVGLVDVRPLIHVGSVSVSAATSLASVVVAPVAPVGLLASATLPHVGSSLGPSQPPSGSVHAPTSSAPVGIPVTASLSHVAGSCSPVGRTPVTVVGASFSSPVSPLGHYESGSPAASRGLLGSPSSGEPDITSPVSSVGSGRTTVSSSSTAPSVTVRLGVDAPSPIRGGAIYEDCDGRPYRQSESDKLDSTKREAGMKSLLFRRLCDEETYAIAFQGDREVSSRVADSVYLFDYIVLHTDWLQDTFLFQRSPSPEQLVDLSPWERAMVKAMPLILPGPRQCPLFAAPDKGASKQFKVLMGLLPWRDQDDLWVSAFHPVAVTDERAQLASMDLVYQVVFGVHVAGLFTDAITALGSSLIDTDQVPPRYALWLWVRKALPSFYNAMLRTRRDTVTGRPIDYAGGGWKLLDVWGTVAATYGTAMSLSSYKDVRDSERYAAFGKALDAASSTNRLTSSMRASDRNIKAGKRDRSVSPPARSVTPSPKSVKGDGNQAKLCIQHALQQLGLMKDTGDPWSGCAWGADCRMLHLARPPTRAKVIAAINSEENLLVGLKKSALASLQAN